MPIPSRARPPTSSRPGRPQAAVKPKATLDELADEVANKLTLKEPRTTKGKTKVALTDEERKATAMRTVNTVSKTLSDLVARSSAKRSQKITDETINSGIHALQMLRQLSPGNVDTERAASSMVGKLVTLELVRVSFSLLFFSLICFICLRIT